MFSGLRVVGNQRGGNHENEHSLLVFRVEDGGGEQRKVVVVTRERLGGGGGGYRRVMATGKRATPKMSACAHFRVGWWWLMGIEGGGNRKEGNPENERLCSLWGWMMVAGGY